MGISVSHGCMKSAYLRFTLMKLALAREAGYMVENITFKDGAKQDTVLVDFGHLQKHMEGDWPETPADPLLVLIAHRDDCGFIRVPQLLPLATRIRELAAGVDEVNGLWDAQKDAIQFAEGLERAAALNEDVTIS